MSPDEGSRSAEDRPNHGIAGLELCPVRGVVRNPRHDDLMLSVVGDEEKLGNSLLHPGLSTRIRLDHGLDSEHLADDGPARVEPQVSVEVERVSVDLAGSIDGCDRRRVLMDDEL